MLFKQQKQQVSSIVPIQLVESIFSSVGTLYTVLCVCLFVCFLSVYKGSQKKICPPVLAPENLELNSRTFFLFTWRVKQYFLSTIKDLVYFILIEDRYHCLTPCKKLALESLIVKMGAKNWDLCPAWIMFFKMSHIQWNFPIFAAYKSNCGKRN